jgi:hypothetical protein
MFCKHVPIHFLHDPKQKKFKQACLANLDFFEAFFWQPKTKVGACVKTKLVVVGVCMT